jgi:hypothetical protein
MNYLDPIFLSLIPGDFVADIEPGRQQDPDSLAPIFSFFSYIGRLVH